MASPLNPIETGPDARNDAVGKLAGIAGFALGKLLSLVEVGRLVIELPSGAKVERTGARPGPEAEVKLNNWRALRRLALKGDVGLATAYFDDDWSSPDLTAVFEFAAVNGVRFMQGI